RREIVLLARIGVEVEEEVVVVVARVEGLAADDRELELPAPLAVAGEAGAVAPVDQVAKPVRWIALAAASRTPRRSLPSISISGGRVAPASAASVGIQSVITAGASIVRP